MSPDVEQGYLIVADVSGYTGFLAGTELEHSTGAFAADRRERELLGDLARLEQSIVGVAA